MSWINKLSEDITAWLESVLTPNHKVNEYFNNNIRTAIKEHLDLFGIHPGEGKVLQFINDRLSSPMPAEFDEMFRALEQIANMPK